MVTAADKIKNLEQAFDEMQKELVIFREKHTANHPKVAPANTRLDKIFDAIQLLKDQQKEIKQIREALTKFVTTMDDFILEDGKVPETLMEMQRDQLTEAYFECFLEIKKDKDETTPEDPQV